MKKIYQINQLDNVAINLDRDSDIKYGHKIALENIKEGQYVIKYGQIIGKAKQDIKKGEWVHSHNLITHLDEDNNYSYNPINININKKKKTFFGYKRKNRRAGIRNDIYIIPTVGCVNSICKEIENRCQIYKKGSIDSIFALTHQFGCSSEHSGQ